MKFLWVFFSGLLLAACNNGDSNMTNTQSHIEIELHEKIENIVQSTPLEISQECLSELDLCWYKFKRSANEKDLPTVTVKNSSTSLTIEKATSFTMVIDKKIGDTIENVDITVRGLPDNSPHEKQKDFIYDLLKKIKSAGWKHYFYPGDPRISGSEIGKIPSPDDVLGHLVSSHPWLDPDYELDIDRWLKIESFYNWYFYNDGVYLTFKAWRRDSKDTPDKTGTYLLSMEFLSERDFWSSGFTKDEEKARWKELLPAQLKRDHDARIAAENNARAAGIEIDENYKDPVIKAIQ
ncbi:hypothetical protein HER21_16490 [Pseudomonas sp. BGM005]|nr:hypothetical protein [Pseudomonas sp. BG5]